MSSRLSFLGSLEHDDEIFAAGVLSKIDSAQNKYQSSFTFFLNEAKAELAKKLLASQGFENFMLWGGYENAERVMLGLFAPYDEPKEEAFDIRAVSFKFREKDELSHRDFLGALISLGITRDTIGDIIVDRGAAVSFLTAPAAELALFSIEKVSRAGVKTTEGILPILNTEKSFKEIEAAVSSLRLDCIVPCAANCSRTEAKKLIASGAVSVKGSRTFESDRRLEISDSFSIRGHGKFILDDVGDLTRSGRIHIRLKKFI